MSQTLNNVYKYYCKYTNLRHTLKWLARKSLYGNSMCDTKSRDWCSRYYLYSSILNIASYLNSLVICFNNKKNVHVIPLSFSLLHIDLLC